MARKTQTPTWVCTECGWTTTKWVGRCGECQTWGSVVEKGAPKLTEVTSSTPTSKAVPIGHVSEQAADRHLTGISELDRVLGGGLVPGVVVLLAGEPGVGKSTLLLDVAAKWAKAGRRTLYVTGEESAAQVRLRAGRTKSLADELYLASETDLGTVLGHIEQTEPSLMVLDSVQTVGTSQADGSPGGVSQVREVTGALVRVAKRRGMAVIIVGHVTKEGSIAGPRTMEHLVDGPADEVGCFEMTDAGIMEVPDPSGLFTSDNADPQPGTCVTVTIEGRRPLLSEVQALVAPSASEKYPRRITHGVEGGRVAMILAVLERKAGLPLSNRDVYVSTVGGARVSDPSADLAIAVSVASAVLDTNFPTRVVALGEVGLAGDLRRVPGLERRVGEAARLGFDLAVVPRNSREAHTKIPTMHGLHVIEVGSVAEALSVLNLRRQRKVNQ